MNIQSRVFVALLAVAALGAGAQDTEDSLDRNYADELPRIAPMEPEAALSSFELHPDFKIELVAAEPLIHDPVAMAFDEAGRLYVAEMRGYSEQRDEDLGAIRVLEDTNGDGLMDRSTVLIDGLRWPTALTCWDGGVFIGVAPDILYCKDTDGDGAADIREVVYTGFGLTNVQGLLNTFKWHFDNRIHGVTSSSAAELRPGNDPSAPALSLRGRDYSWDPRTMEVRAESGGGQHGMTFDEFGRKFVCNNSNHCQLIHYEDRHIARNPYLAPPAAYRNVATDGASADVYRISPVEPWRIVRTRLRVQGLVPGPVEGGGTAAGYFTSATGITAYKGNAFPEMYRGNLFIGDVGSNLVHRKNVREEGLTMVAERADANTEFLRSTDIWFRPVQFANGPEGALYVADMYREVIEHPLSLHPIIKQHLDLTSGQDRGRIYRIVPKDFEQPIIPDLSKATTEDLCTYLAHENGWHRETAARLLHQRNDVRAATKLVSMIDSLEDNPVGHIQVLYALASLGEGTAQIKDALYSSNPRVREHAARIAGQSPSLTQFEDRIFSVLAEEEDARAAYEMVLALGNTKNLRGTAERFAEITEKYRDDPWMRLAVLSGSLDSAPSLLISMLKNGASDEWEGQVALYVGATANEQSTKLVLDSMLTEKRVRDRSDEEKTLVVRRLIEGAKLAKRPGMGTLLANHPLAASMVQQQVADARAVLDQEGGKEADRVRALETLGFATFEVARPYLLAPLSEGTSSTLQSAALDSLRQFENEECASLILDAWPSLGPAAKSEAIEVLFAREAWIAVALDAIDAGTFNVAYLDSVRRGQLVSHKDASIRDRATKILAAHEATPRDEIVESYRVALDMTGDPARGKAIYLENCSQCHRIGTDGYAVGPDLTTMAQAGPDKILVNVLDPNREVNPQYVNFTVETEDWETYSGIIASESATSVTLRRANGAEDTILRVNIESIKSEKLSIMPEGWEETIDPQGIADLIAYLSGLE